MRDVLKNPAYKLIALGVVVLVFTISYYALANLPGTRDLACVEGAYLTPANIGFSLIFSLMIGVFVAGFIELLSVKRSGHGKLLSLSGIGLTFGMLTTVCTICTFTLIVPFAAGFLALFTTYNLVFKILGLLSLAYALYKLEQQLNDNCACEVG
jgi:ABC-type transport system involved in cytochrome c biogenesis permease subunit